MANKYWVGDGSDPRSNVSSNWSTTSGGTGGAGISSYDTLIFDSGSSSPCDIVVQYTLYFAGIKVYDFDSTIRFRDDTFTTSNTTRTIYNYDGLIIEGGANFAWLDHYTPNSSTITVQMYFYVNSNYSTDSNVIPIDLNGNTCVIDFLYLSPGSLNRSTHFLSSAYFVSSSNKTGSYYHIQNGVGGITVPPNTEVTVECESFAINSTQTYYLYERIYTGSNSTINFSANCPEKNTVSTLWTAGRLTSVSGSININLTVTNAHPTSTKLVYSNGPAGFSRINLKQGKWNIQRYVASRVQQLFFYDDSYLVVASRYDVGNSSPNTPAISQILSFENRTTEAPLVDNVSSFLGTQEFGLGSDIEVIYPQGESSKYINIELVNISTITATLTNAGNAVNTAIIFSSAALAFGGSEAKFRVGYSRFLNAGCSVSSTKNLSVQHLLLSSVSTPFTFTNGARLYLANFDTFQTLDVRLELQTASILTVDGVVQTKFALFDSEHPIKQNSTATIYSRGTSVNTSNVSSVMTSAGNEIVDWDFSGAINSDANNSGSQIIVYGICRNFEFDTVGTYPRINIGNLQIGEVANFINFTDDTLAINAITYIGNPNSTATVIRPSDLAVAKAGFYRVFFGSVASNTSNCNINGFSVFGASYKVDFYTATFVGTVSLFAGSFFSGNSRVVNFNFPVDFYCGDTDIPKTDASGCFSFFENFVFSSSSDFRVCVDRDSYTAYDVTPYWNNTSSTNSYLYFDSVGTATCGVYSSTTDAEIWWKLVSFPNNSGFFSWESSATENTINIPQLLTCDQGWDQNRLPTKDCIIKAGAIYGWSVKPAGFAYKLNYEPTNTKSLNILNGDWEFDQITGKTSFWKSDTVGVKRTLTCESWIFTRTSNTISSGIYASYDVDMVFTGSGVVYRDNTGSLPSSLYMINRFYDSFTFVLKAGQSIYLDSDVLNGNPMSYSNNAPSIRIDENSPAGDVTFLRESFWDANINEDKADVYVNTLTLIKPVNNITLRFENITQVNTSRTLGVRGSIDFRNTGNAGEFTIIGLGAIAWSRCGQWSSFYADVNNGQFLLNADKSVFGTPTAPLWVNVKNTIGFTSAGNVFGIPIADKEVSKTYDAFLSWKVGRNNFCFFGTDVAPNEAWTTDKTIIAKDFEIDANVGQPTPGSAATEFAIDFRKVKLELRSLSIYKFFTSTTTATDAYWHPDLTEFIGGVDVNGNYFLVMGHDVYNARDDIISSSNFNLLISGELDNYIKTVSFRNFSSTISATASEGINSDVYLGNNSAEQNLNQKITHSEGLDTTGTKRFWVLSGLGPNRFDSSPFSPRGTLFEDFVYAVTNDTGVDNFINTRLWNIRSIYTPTDVTAITAVDCEKNYLYPCQGIRFYAPFDVSSIQD